MCSPKELHARIPSNRNFWVSHHLPRSPPKERSEGAWFRQVMPGPVFGWGVFGFICPKPFVWLGGILLDFQGHVLARMIFFNHPRPCTFRCSWLGCVPFRLPKAICVARVIFVKFQDHVLVRVILFNHPRPCTFRYLKPFVWLGLSVFIKSSKTMCWLG